MTPRGMMCRASLMRSALALASAISSAESVPASPMRLSTFWPSASSDWGSMGEGVIRQLYPRRADAGKMRAALRTCARVAALGQGRQEEFDMTEERG